MTPKVSSLEKNKKHFFFLKKKIPKWQTQKKVSFQNHQFSIFLVKISFFKIVNNYCKKSAKKSIYSYNIAENDQRIQK